MQQKIISYALFGYERAKSPDCFDFHSYLRGFLINLRLNRLLYPDWKTYLNIDSKSYNAFSELFDNLPIIIKIHPDNQPLCLAMLWRLSPIFDLDANGQHKYSHVICRDLDSPTTYRERQCVEQWVLNDKTAHAITDSVSHNIPMLGGMIGFRPQYFTMRVAKSMDELLSKKPNIDFRKKGTDQDLINSVIYPAIAQPGNDSITQHYILGYPNTFLSDWSDKIPNIDVIGVPKHFDESNDICGHIGAAGYYPPPLHKFLSKYKNAFADIQKAEKPFASIFYWSNENIF